MAEIVNEIERLRGLARRQSDQGQYEIAAKTLHDGIEALESALTRPDGHGDRAHPASRPGDTEDSFIAAKLADLHGMLGGVRRKQGDLVRAIAAYDQGFRYESNPRYAIVNTYNALNRLVTRILLCPSALSDPDALRGVNDLEIVDVPKTLNELWAELKQEVDGVRSNDFWAAGDLAFISALNGDDRGALDALQRFESCSPPPPTSAFSAYIHWIDAVAQLDTPRKKALEKLNRLFQNRMNTASGNELA